MATVTSSQKIQQRVSMEDFISGLREAEAEKTSPE